MSARWAVVSFPGSNCERDCLHALRNVLGYETIEVWHKDLVPDDVDCIVIPGGFSYGDYLRAGALAAMSPVMKSIMAHAERGTLILGICNGFQVLCESGLLPGALVKNEMLRFRCRDAYLRIENADSPFTRGTLGKGDIIRVPIAHGYGNYYIPESERAGIEKQIIFRYCDEQGNITAEANPNGSAMNIAGISNARGNVLGMMPHPERACEPILGGTDGIKILKAMGGVREVI